MAQFLPYETHLWDFEKLIKQMDGDLQIYAKRPEAKQQYVQQRSELINRFVNIHYGLESEIKLVEPFFGVAPIFRDMQISDEELGIILLEMHINPQKKHRGLIRYNPFFND